MNPRWAVTFTRYIPSHRGRCQVPGLPYSSVVLIEKEGQGRKKKRKEKEKKTYSLFFAKKKKKKKP